MKVSCGVRIGSRCQRSRSNAYIAARHAIFREDSDSPRYWERKKSALEKETIILRDRLWQAERKFLATTFAFKRTRQSARFIEVKTLKLFATAR